MLTSPLFLGPLVGCGHPCEMAALINKILATVSLPQKHVEIVILCSGLEYGCEEVNASSPADSVASS